MKLLHGGGEGVKKLLPTFEKLLVMQKLGIGLGRNQVEFSLLS